MPEVITPTSPRWPAFVGQLEDAINQYGCDSRSQRLAKLILKSMRCVDVAATIEFCEEHGGYCDCEILLNVDPW